MRIVETSGDTILPQTASHPAVFPSLLRQGYRERIHMKKLLNERIQTRVFEETEEV